MRSRRRTLFVATILVGSFLLFLVQPMVARMALPRLGGAPAVWNSAMLVYQALLLGGYAYAHRLARLPLRHQTPVHLALLVLAAVTLPLSLAHLPPARAGFEVLWVPALLGLTVGPTFLLVSAQAPLMQRWYAADPAGGEPWALYAASNLGSFAGLLAYPLLAEPLLSLRAQSLAWSAGYLLLIVLVALCGRAGAEAPPLEQESPLSLPVPWRRVLLWLVLAAVPSGLMLSTTTHLTTDLVAMPLLWVIPLGIYLLSFVIAFADRRSPARTISALAWPVVFAAGGLAMVSRGAVGLLPVAGGLTLLFFVCVALHSRMYDLRPGADRLTLFYLVMSAGGVLGGAFTALVAPVVFDWAWEHPVLVIAAALLLPADALPDWRRMPGLEPAMARLALWTLCLFAAGLAWQLLDFANRTEPGTIRWVLTAGLALCGLALVRLRGLALVLLVATMLAQGGTQTIADTRDRVRERSYFGIYTVRTNETEHMRTIAHGSTLHGEQSLDPARRLVPISYYGPTSGAGIAFAGAPKLFGKAARIGVVGLGAGTLACYARPGQAWTFFEIDPTVLAFSRDGRFTYLSGCAPWARVAIGDARLELARAARGGIDLLAIDAFSSDSIPLHLLTGEAFDIYLKALAPRGVLLVHISNRFIDLEPVISAAARTHGLAAAIRVDNPPREDGLTASEWVALTRDPGQLRRLESLGTDAPWQALAVPATRAWSDDHASILPYIRWANLTGNPQ